MNHAVTVSGLLGVLGFIGGFLMCGFGMMSAFAAGMATAPGPDAGKSGCITALVGIVLMVLCAWWLA